VIGRLRSEEGGWALVTALVLMTIMGGFAAATLVFVDNEQRQSAKGRERETAFNVAEAALNAQIYELARNWPGAGGATDATIRYPSSCTETSTDTRCPSSSTLTNLYSSPDTTPTANWVTDVRDNSGSTGAQTFWSDGMLSTAPTYDANGDGRLWVRSQSTVQGHIRKMVALIRTEPQQEDLPHVSLTAGRVSISNNGNKEIVDTQGTAAFTGAVHVRCTPALLETTTCYGHTLGTNGLTTLTKLQSLLDTQISPDISDYGYTGGAAMSSDELARLKLAAQTQGTYYTSCPTAITGSLVFIDSTTANCAYQSNTDWNSATSPGDVIMTGGSISFTGSGTFYGLIYDANRQNSSGWLVSVGGTAKIQGGVIVDGNGGMLAGGSGLNIVFDDRAFQNVKSYGGAGLVQNTWREIRG
jgi:Tfp pilus assembly protein PilX